LHPQLSALADGRGVAQAHDRGPLRGDERRDGGNARETSDRSGDGRGWADISGQSSKTLKRYLDEPFDHVTTVCDAANEACPFFPWARPSLRWSFEDPSLAEGSEDERLAMFRSVRDRIR